VFKEFTNDSVIEIVEELKIQNTTERYMHIPQKLSQQFTWLASNKRITLQVTKITHIYTIFLLTKLPG